jgi:uncharacterized protein (TIGR02145 family)
LVNLAIGNGAPVTGEFSQLTWTDYKYFMKIELELSGPDNYLDMGTFQILSVPYALESKHASSLSLTDSLGKKYDVTVDTAGNLITTLVSDTVYGMPCPGIPTIEYEGQVYNTVQIASQCWLRENLNIGTRIDGIIDQTDNQIIEKYCYDDNEDNCNIYGGLYQWNEMMQYDTIEGIQGICPDGWHLPTDNEWFVLENYVDPTINNPDQKYWRGVDAGIKLALGGSSGFDGLYGGLRHWDDATFREIEITGYFRPSSAVVWHTPEAWYRALRVTESGSYRNGCMKSYGHSVRCVKDD